MSHDFNTNNLNNDEWLTPPDILEALGPFDLDPCAPHPLVRPWDTAKNHYCKLHDGLNQQWFGRVWCNPPYGRKGFKWLNKLAEHGRGVALIFARTETIGFHEEVWNKATAVFFFKGRLRFHYISGEAKDVANAPSCLVAYGAEEIPVLEKFQDSYPGKLIKLDNK